MGSSLARWKLHEVIPVVSNFASAAWPVFLQIMEHSISRVITARCVVILFRKKTSLGASFVSAHELSVLWKLINEWIFAISYHRSLLFGAFFSCSLSLFSLFLLLFLFIKIKGSLQSCYSFLLNGCWSDDQWLINLPFEALATVLDCQNSVSCFSLEWGPNRMISTFFTHLCSNQSTSQIQTTRRRQLGSMTNLSWDHGI